MNKKNKYLKIIKITIEYLVYMYKHTHFLKISLNLRTVFKLSGKCQTSQGLWGFFFKS